MTSLNNHSSAGHTAAYLKLPIVLTNAAWLRLVYLANPARVDEMGTRLASVVQTAWQELSLQPTAKHIQFHLYHKEEEGPDRALALLVLSIVEPSDEPSYLRIELQEESLPGNPDTE
ncbi:hypothetical protein [Pseudomonas aeruginosa]